MQPLLSSASREIVWGAALIGGALLAVNCDARAAAATSGRTLQEPSAAVARRSSFDTLRAGAAPALPRVTVDVSMPGGMKRASRVAAGGDLQAAINDAAPGDQILLPAGATFTGNYTLPAKSGPGWVIIRTTGSLPSAGTRVHPSDAGQMAKIVAADASYPVIQTAPGAHNYRLVGLEITVAGKQAGAVVSLGDGSGAQKRADQVPHDLVLDRVYVHGTPTLNFQRCIALNSGSAAIVGSYISECHGKGFDSQAIGGWSGPGPYRIENNYLEGAGENVMFGGADPQIPDMLPRDIVIRHNYFYKPPAWKGVWEVKNLMEIKLGQRILVDGNIFENNWADAQVGFAVLFKSVNQGGTAPWSQTSDVTFQNNVVRNSAHGIDVDAHPESNPAVPASRLKFSNNLLEKIGNGDYPGGRMWQISGIQGLTIQHNTGLNTAFNGVIFYGAKVSHLVMTDNIFGTGTNYLANLDGHGLGTAALEWSAGPGWIFRRNVVVGAQASAYPPDNFYPATVADVGFVDPSAGSFQLSSHSPYRGAATDHTDIGANVQTITAQTKGVVEGKPTAGPLEK